jgi:hypothetical protein
MKMTQQTPSWAPDAIPTHIGWIDPKTREQLTASKGLEAAEGTEGVVPNSPKWAAEYAASLEGEMPVDPTPPANTTPPVITGSGVVGVEVTVELGVWTGTPEPVLTQQWMLDDQVVEGATELSYTPVEGDVGKVLKCAVTADNSAGTSTISSNEITVSATEP